jgi:hypothetical protein
MTCELDSKRTDKKTQLPLPCILDTVDRVHTGHRCTDLESEKWRVSKASDELGFASDGILLEQAGRELERIVSYRCCLEIKEGP